MNNKLKNSRIIEHDISIIFNAQDLVIFKNQNEIFSLFKVKTQPNQHGFYPIDCSDFAIWIPIISNDSKQWNNYLNVCENEILEKPVKNKGQKRINTKGKYRITFGKYSDGLKFLGLFMEFGKQGGKITYKKVANAIILNPQNGLKIN